MNKKSPTRPTPWGETWKFLVSRLRKDFGIEGLLLAAFDAKSPQLDEVLVFDKLPADGLTQWLAQGIRSDGLLQKALTYGSASGTVGDTAWPGGKDLNKKSAAAYFVTVDGFRHIRRWTMLVTRTTRGVFTDEELMRLSFAFNEWIAHFNKPRESRMIRLLLGHDDRIISADPRGEDRITMLDINIRRVMSELRETALQRWPKLKDDEWHDVVFSLGDKPFWIVMRRQHAVTDETAENWYLELRTLDSREMKPNGVVADDRIGEALGYIHDRYNTSPGLEEVSNAVQISAFHFHRLFSRLAGETPKQYVLQKQIQMAKWMLRAHKMPIAQIAKETGFASHGHFTSTFRRMEKKSPTQYRDEAEA